MGRGTYAFRDQDEELCTFIADSDDDTMPLYEPHHSPPDMKGKSAKSTKNLNGLTESTMLKMYVNHHRAQRRRKLLGGALFVGIALLGVVPVLLSQETEQESALELALSAPYKSLRLRGETHARHNPLREDADGGITEDLWAAQDANVGDADPHDHDERVTDPDGVRGFAEGNDENDDEDEFGGTTVQDDAPLGGVGNALRETLTGTQEIRVQMVDDGEERETEDDTPTLVPSI